MKKLIGILMLTVTLHNGKLLAQQPGDLDSSFNAVGFNTTDNAGREDEAYAIELQSNGRIVVAGYMNDSAGDYDHVGIARYKTDGTLDNSFNGTGIYTQLIGDYCNANAVAIQSDGKIVAAGVCYNSATSNDFFLLRLNVDGTIDNSFGTNGVVITDFNFYDDRVESIAIQSDGKIVVVGSAVVSLYHEMALARYNANGTLDNSFGTNGKLTSAIGSGDLEAFSVAIQSNGKIVVGGYAYNDNSDMDFALARYNSDGTTDASFNSTGWLMTDIDGFNEEIYSIAIQSDGKIIATGYSNNDSYDEFATARYNSDGSIDNSFGTTGIQLTSFFSYEDIAFSVKIQSDNKIVVSGYADDAGIYLFALARYNSDGSLDNSFGGDGLVTTNINNNDDAIYASIIQADGKIVVAGESYNGNNRDFAVARYITGTNVGVADIANAVNAVYIYPNPVESGAELFYELNEAENISVQLFDVQGKLINTLIDNEKQNAGTHQFKIQFPEATAAGNYLLRINSDKGAMNIKVVKQ